MILDAAKKVPGGFGKLNAVVMEKMRRWVSSVAIDIVQNNEGGLADTISDGLCRNHYLTANTSESLQLLSAVSHVLSDMGKMDDAEVIYRRVVDARTNILGPDDPASLRARMNLANMLRKKGDSVEAHQIFQEVGDVCKRTLPQHHPVTSMVQVNFALLLREEGNLDAAQQILELVLASCSKPEVEWLHDVKSSTASPDTRMLDAKLNLSMVLHDKGLLDESQQLKEHVVRGYTDILGRRNKRTLGAQNNLALLLRAKGDTEEACRLLKVVVEEHIAQLGTQHALTFSAQMNLGTCLPRKLYEHVVAEFNAAVFGSEYEDTLLAQIGIQWNLADLRCEMGDETSGLDLYSQVVEKLTKLKGFDHTRTLQAKMAFGKALHNNGENIRAQILFQEVISLHCEMDTVASMACMLLGDVLGDLDNPTEARICYVKAAAGLSFANGPGHVDTLLAQANLARCLHIHAEEIQETARSLADKTEARRLFEGGVADWKEAQRLYEIVVDGHRVLFGPLDHRTVDAQANYVARLDDCPDQAAIWRAVYVTTSQRADHTKCLESLFMAVIDGYKAIYGSTHDDVLRNTFSYAVFLQRHSRTKEANAVFCRAAADALVQGEKDLPLWLQEEFSDDSLTPEFAVLLACWVRNLTRN